MFIESHLPGIFNLLASWWVKYPIWPPQTAESLPQGYTANKKQGSDSNASWWSSKPAHLTMQLHDTPWIAELWVCSVAETLGLHFTTCGDDLMQTSRHPRLEEGLWFLAAEQLMSLRSREWSQAWGHGHRMLSHSAKLVRARWCHRYAVTASQPVWAMGPCPGVTDSIQYWREPYWTTFIQQRRKTQTPSAATQQGFVLRTV